MDQLTDIYVNEAGPFGYLGKRKSLVKSSESIYENVLIHSLEPNKTAALSGAEVVNKSSCRAAAVGLLCLLVLTGLITVVCLFTKGSSEWKMEMVLLQTSYNNLTQERDQLKTSYNNLTQELNKLHTVIENMTKTINDLQRKLQVQSVQRVGAAMVKALSPANGSLQRQMDIGSEMKTVQK
ncbi:hypothetical protein PFLUV_G00007180 [Perca fluviatilis]|uniref:Uncharacterized protein n=1 Tax=Perca fluviatilis TaxID=8168 RepID=A0A6A5FM92_PERFL|nr:hypothetical protein PFLUV_G00007180 [Perca fluviatilis]